MKFQTYSYKEGDVKLDFSFKDDENIKYNKNIFIELLKEATSDLKKED